MKAQQRKQLEKNELADRLVRWWRGDPEHKSKSSPIWWAVLGLIALAVILYVAWHYYSQSALGKRSAAWADVDLATENSRLEELAEANRGTEPAWAAKAQLARAALQKGLDELGSEVLRSGAVANIEKARDWYGQLAKDATGDVELQREAALGMAKAEEALIGIPKAENRKRCAARWPERLNFTRIRPANTAIPFKARKRQRERRNSKQTKTKWMRFTPI